jgi:hypothetical protein
MSVTSPNMKEKKGMTAPEPMAAMDPPTIKAISEESANLNICMKVMGLAGGSSAFA